MASLYAKRPKTCCQLTVRLLNCTDTFPFASASFTLFDRVVLAFLELSVVRKGYGLLICSSVFDRCSLFVPKIAPMKLVVIGGGLAGLSAIKALRALDKEKLIEIVLIEPKDFTEIIWAGYRSPFEEWVAEGSTFLLEKFCTDKKVEHVRSIVKELTDSEVSLENGTTIAFDVVLIAVGASIPFDCMGNGLPNGYDGTRAERLKLLKDRGGKILNAKSVLVVGGGLIGTELSGDIAAYAKKAGRDVKVTLVHAHDHLCPELREASARMVEGKLKKIGVNIVLNDKAIEKDGKMVLQSSGAEVEADEVIYVVGLKANNDFVKVEGGLNEKGFVNTDEYFRVNGSANVFAFGDCCTTLENAGAKINYNKDTIAHNLKAALDGKKDVADLKKAAPGVDGAIATTGPNSGVLQTPWFYTQYLMPWFKNSTMMLFVPRDALGLK